MIVRHFDPTRDKPDNIARLNPFPAETQASLAPWYALPFPPENLIVAEADGKLVGVLHFFDAGFHWAILDGAYLAQEYRSLANARALGRFAEEELGRRGIPLGFICAPPRLAKALQRNGWTSLYTPLTLLGKRFTR
jgi:GNAT superfamily N-acetyltransferase